MRNSDIWYSYTLKPYQLNEPNFYDASEFEWTTTLEANFSVIEKEVIHYLEHQSLKPYFNKGLVNKIGAWKTDGLLFWGYFLNKNYSHFIQSWKVIKQIPGVVSFSISVLEGGSIIHPHNGDTNAIIRVHFPIVIPEGLPQCSFTVNGETKGWEEGKPILFNDAQIHHAQNLSKSKRVVLLIDVVRPEFIDQQVEICAKVLNGLAWQWETQRWPGVRRFPLLIKQIHWKVNRFIIRLALKVNRWGRP